MMKRRSKGLILILVLTLFLSSCGANSSAASPKATVEKLLSFMKEGDLDGAGSLLTDPDSMAQIKEAFIDPLAALVYQKTFENGTFALDKEVIDGDKATVEMKMTSISAVGSLELNQKLVEAQKEFPKDLSPEDIQKEKIKALEKLDWKEFDTMEQTLLYHLEKIDGVWKIDANATEIMQP